MGQLTSACPACGAVPPPRARFCGLCGALLDDADAAPRARAQRPGRRWMTVAVAVLVGAVGAAVVGSGNVLRPGGRAERMQVVVPTDVNAPPDGPSATASDWLPGTPVDPGAPPRNPASLSVLEEPADEDDVMPDHVADLLGVGGADVSSARLAQRTQQAQAWVFETEDELSQQRLVCVAVSVGEQGLTACGEPMAGPDGVVVRGSTDETLVALVTDGVDRLPAGSLPGLDAPVVVTRNVALVMR